MLAFTVLVATGAVLVSITFSVSVSRLCTLRQRSSTNWLNLLYAAIWASCGGIPSRRDAGPDWVAADSRANPFGRPHLARPWKTASFLPLPTRRDYFSMLPSKLGLAVLGFSILAWF